MNRPQPNPEPKTSSPYITKELAEENYQKLVATRAFLSLRPVFANAVQATMWDLHNTISIELIPPAEEPSDIVAFALKKVYEAGQKAGENGVQEAFKKLMGVKLDHGLLFFQNRFGQGSQADRQGH